MNEGFNPQIIEKKPVQPVTPDGGEELTPEEMEGFNEMKKVATEIQNINPNEAAKMLKNNPEKAKGLESKVKKFWAIANIVGDVAVLGIGMAVMYKNMNPDETMDFNPVSITALVATTLSILKLFYDSVSTNGKK